jgi:cytochrome b
MVRVWDPLVRVGHWALVASVTVAWLTQSGWDGWHEPAGYVALAIVGLRIVWGWTGSANARFASFVVSPAKGIAYAGQMLSGREPRYIGHNPLGGWMIVALLLVIALLGATGWLYTTDRFWGVEWVETLHSRLADVLVVLVCLHVLGVLYACYRHRENLIGAMIHGRKRDTE